MYWDFAVILVFLGLAVPWLGRQRIRQLLRAPQISTMDRLVLYASTSVYQWLAAGIILWRVRVHDVRLSIVGVTVPYLGQVLATSAVLCILILLYQVMSLRRMMGPPLESKGVLAQLVARIFPHGGVERVAFLGLVASVAVCEEFIYRGFVQGVFEDWLGSIAGGILMSSVLFSLAHLYQGRRGVASTLLVGLLFSTIRVWTGSLIPCMAGHFVADAAVGFLGPVYMRSATVEPAASKEPETGIGNVN